MTDQEKEMMQAVRQGKEKGYDYFLSRYAQDVSRFLVQTVGNELDAEELAQDTFVKAFSHIGSYDPEQASFSTWLRRIAWNTALNHLKRRRLPTVSLEDEDAFLHKADEAEPERVELEQLDRAIERLRPPERSLIQLYYYDELPLKEIAYIMDSNPLALANRLKRIRKKLYKLIKEENK